ncbi:unnamed protein product [Brachionus calyciflorus]|uniref:MULE transposase domain-containing protein n=1 Tax=Brachionus calyciflorus TaxID=104777 RepID=A0A813XAB3_9BILA|nr:unnamed protein product [Brachionus calyciflorus]
MEVHEILSIDSNFGIENVVNSHPVIVFKNYKYWWRKDNKDMSSRYVCSERTCYSSLTIKNKTVVKEAGRHHHEPLDNAEIASLQATQELKKEIVTDLSKSVQSCYNNKQVELLQSKMSERAIASNFPSFQKMSNLLQKRRINKLPTISTNFIEFNITGDYTLTAKKEPFLRYDNKKNNRIFIFFDDDSLKILSESEEWYMDGTFKTAPLQLSQLFTIDAAIKDSNVYTTVPCAYILTNKKDEKTYKEVFGIIKDFSIQKNLTLNPKIIMADFEKASTQAIKYHFPNIIIKGCWFHFRQAIFRNAVKLGLKTSYNQYEYKEFINLLGALSFIPPNKVLDGFNIVKEFMPTDPKCTELLNYFENQWLKNTDLNDWNHYDSYVKTNNRIEGFHSGLNKMVIKQRPNIFHLIDFLKVQQACTLVDYARLKLGQDIRKKSKKNQEKELSLELIKLQYVNSDDLKNQLLALSQYVQYPYEYWYNSSDFDSYFDEFVNIAPLGDTVISLTDNSTEASIATSVVTERINETNTEDFVYANLRTVELPDLVWNYQQEQINSYDENTEVEINVENTDQIYNIGEINADVVSVRSRVCDNDDDEDDDDDDDDDEDDEESDKFDYVRSLMNHEVLARMSRSKRAEAERKKNLINEQMAKLVKI